jgi:hypothetical protein
VLLLIFRTQFDSSLLAILREVLEGRCGLERFVLITDPIDRSDP